MYISEESSLPVLTFPEDYLYFSKTLFRKRFRVFFSAIVVPMDLYTHLWNPLEALEGASWDETALKVISMNFLKIVTNYYQTTNHSVWWVRKMYGRWNSGSNQFDAPNWHLPSRWRRIQSTLEKVFTRKYLFRIMHLRVTFCNISTFFLSSSSISVCLLMWFVFHFDGVWSHIFHLNGQNTAKILLKIS